MRITNIKLKIAISMVICILFVFNVNSFSITKPTLSFKAPKIQDVKSVIIHPGVVGINKMNDIIYDLGDLKQKKVIESILKELRTGKIIGEMKNGFFSHAYTPAQLIILLKNGKSIYLSSAYDLKLKKISEDQTQVININISQQISLVTDNMNIPIRMVCPMTKKLIDSHGKY